MVRISLCRVIFPLYALFVLLFASSQLSAALPTTPGPYTLPYTYNGTTYTKALAMRTLSNDQAPHTPTIFFYNGTAKFHGGYSWFKFFNSPKVLQMRSVDEVYGNDNDTFYEHIQPQNPDTPFAFTSTNDTCLDGSNYQSSETVYQETAFTYQNENYHCNFAFVDTSTVVLPASMFFSGGGAASSIYGDALGPGWTDASVNTTVDFISTVHLSGTYGLALTYKAPQASLVLRTTGFNTTGSEALSFDIRGNGTGNQQLTVSLYDANGTELVRKLITPYVLGGSIASNQWRNVRIPLADLNATRRTITGIRLQSATAASVTLDNFEFTTRGATEQVYKDAFSAAWELWGPWGVASTNRQATPPGRTGTYALGITFAQAWGGIEVRRIDPIDTVNKRALVFRVRGVSNNGDGQLYVGVRDDDEVLHAWVPITDHMINPDVPPFPSNKYSATRWYTVTIPLSELGAENMMLNTVAFMSGKAGTFFLDEIYLVQGLEFPLKGVGDGPYTTTINAVLDHSRHAAKDTRDKQCSNGVVTAYTGEEGVKGIGTVPGVDFSVWPNPSAVPSCNGVTSRGLPRTDGGVFSLGGQYDSTEGLQTDNPPGNEGGLFLFYDGHAGYDYPKVNGTKVHSVADGTVYNYTYAGLPADEYPIRVDHGNGHESFYLHLSARSVANGAKVRAGQLIGGVGKGHLHFHLRVHGELVDPYGWTDTTRDDPLRNYAVNVRLWK